MKLTKIEEKRGIVDNWLNKTNTINWIFGVDKDNKEFKIDILSAFLHKSARNDGQLKELINRKTGLKLCSSDKFKILGNKVLNLIVISKYINERTSISNFTIECSTILSKKNMNKMIIESNFYGLVLHKIKNIENTNVYADIFEAIVGVVYLHKGSEECDKFINKFFKNFYKLNK